MSVNLNDLAPQDIAKWHRMRAKEHMDMAKQVESLFNVEKPVQDATLPMPRTASLTAGEIKRELARKGMRVSGLAKHFKVEAWEIETIIKNPANGLEIGDKGWVKNKGNPIVD